MPVSFAHTREIVEESELNVYGKVYFFLDNVAKSGMSAVQLVLLTIANLANPISINDKTHGIRYKYTHYSFLPLYI